MMALYDRHYSRGGDGPGWGGGRSFLHELLRILNWTFPIGTYVGVQVRVHITFVILLGIELLARGRTGLPWNDHILWTLRWSSLLFLSVLMHEYGHALACRAVGGSARQILMWPLGGLAYVAPPKRPWPSFVTTICGPLVNLVLAAAAYLTLLVWFGSDTPADLYPFEMIRIRFWPSSELAVTVLALFVTNYALLLFNLLLVFYPFDGGRIVQEILWWRLGYYRSMKIAVTIGMVGAVVTAIIGLTFGSFLLVLIAAFGFVTCYQQRQMLQYSGEYELGFEYGDPYAAGAQPEARPGFFARRRAARAEARMRKEHQRRQAMEDEINRILDKVHNSGLASLSARERRTLQQGTERRQRGV